MRDSQREMAKHIARRIVALRHHESWVSEERRFVTGKLLTVRIDKRGLRLMLDNGRSAVWRCHQDVASLVIRALKRYAKALREHRQLRASQRDVAVNQAMIANPVKGHRRDALRRMSCRSKFVMFRLRHRVEQISMMSEDIRTRISYLSISTRSKVTQ